MIVLDTTVLVYAVGDDHELRERARSIVEAVGAGQVRATTTAEAIQEFTHVRARRRSRRDATAVARGYADLLAPLLPVTADSLAAGLVLFERHKTLGCFDAVLAAATIAQEHTALVSADRAFDTVRRLRFVDLADRGAVDALLD